MPFTRSKGWIGYAGFGVLAAVAGIAAGHLVASLLNPAASPVLAIGSTVIDLTPTPMKEWAVATFGTKDKPILVGSVLLGALGLAALAGVLTRIRFVFGAALLLLLVATCAVAAALRPVAEPADVVPSLAAGLVGLAALGGLTQAARVPAEETTLGPNRRSVLLMGVAGLAWFAIGSTEAARRITAYRTRPGQVTLPPPTSPAPQFPTGLEKRYDEITALRTPNDDFYRVDINLTVPAVAVDDWKLTIDGDVERELELDFDELAAMSLIERDITLTCVSNEVGGKYVGGARWLGVPLKDLLDRVGVGDGADQILSTAVDGFTISTPLAVALDGRDAMVAIGMNGEPLPREHGFPARLVTPGIYGYVGATKWLTKLTLTTYEAEEAYWTERDWAIDAPIKVSSRIDTPKPLATLDPGQTVIGGIAWAQHRGIAKVEVRIDGGAWQAAKLGPSAGIDYWQQWYLPWEATSGSHMLACRATTKDGDVQTAVRATPFPAGSSGIQEVVVRVN
ncbi:molybdopterin-dependent oxidoreductase [Nocardioides speluncae]|uniref:molybdopterin-dependent oxidoreductase n=1 Tax=Nocardioides speluncae TaxID=2670337 RepID=UPI000D6864F4|nr:molybdopterin-dependent oxidoreductase [Nocardioides speluncae]